MPKTKFIGRSHPEENELLPKRDTGRPIQRREKDQLFPDLVALETKNRGPKPRWPTLQLDATMTQSEPMCPTCLQALRIPEGCIVGRQY